MTRKLALVHDDTTSATVTHLPAPRDLTTLPQRTRELDRARENATAKALSPDAAADMNDHVRTLLVKLSRKPKDPGQLLRDFGQRMYVTGRMDQADDDRLARAQADALADSALAQVINLVYDPDGGDAA